MNCTNTTNQPSVLDKDSLMSAIAMLRNAPPQEEVIASAGCGKDYFEALKNTATLITRCFTTEPMLGSFGGFNVYVDDDLPPDVVEFRNPDGKVLYAATLSK